MASNSKFPKVVLIYDRYSKATTDKVASIEIRITYNRKQKYISTGISILPHQWNNGSIINHNHAVQLNKILNEKLSSINNTIFSIMAKGEFNLKLLSSKNTKSITFIEYCRQKVDIKKYGKTKGTKERYDIFLKYFISWGKMTTFEDISEHNLIMYDSYLESKQMKPSSRWGNHHKFLNAIITSALEEGLIKYNPYKKVNFNKVSGEHYNVRYLTSDEFHKLCNLHNLPKYLERVRDVFIFQTYTCLSYSDLRLFDSSKIQEINGMQVYSGYRYKTKNPFTIPLLPQALHLINIYKGKLPVISLPKYNLFLKKIAALAGIDKPISSHWARHTGATLLLNKGVDLKIISKICGHSSTRITEQVYAKLLDETIVEAMDAIKSKP